MEQRRKSHKKIFIIMQLILFCIILVPCCFIVFRFYEYEKENLKLEQVSQIVAQYTTAMPATSMNTGTAYTEVAFMDIHGLKDINQEIMGYLQIPGTEIDYPVMDSEIADKYLNQDFFGEESIYGCIYADAACYEGGVNLVMYGHNMRSGKMFGGLKNYLQEDYLDSHNQIYFYKQDQLELYTICAVLQASSKNAHLTQNLIPYTEAEFDSLKELVESSGKIYNDFIWGDSLITLVTCTSANKSGRLLVIGKRTDVIYKIDSQKEKGELYDNK